MEEEGKKILIDLLGSVCYRRMVTELRKPVYSEDDYLDLARKLELEQFYEDLR